MTLASAEQANALNSVQRIPCSDDQVGDWFSSSGGDLQLSFREPALSKPACASCAQVTINPDRADVAKELGPEAL